MPPRRRKSSGGAGRAGGAGRGSGSGRGDGRGDEIPGSGVSGGSSSGVGLQSAGGGDIDMDIIDVDPFRPHSTAHVDVVYVEQALRRAEAVPERGPIRHGWLQGCVRDTLEEWQEHLPGVGVEDLRGTMIPGSARTYPDLAQGRGLVTVELEDRGSDRGILSRLATAQGRTLTMEQIVADTRRQFVEMEARVEAREARMDAREARMEARMEARLEEARRESHEHLLKKIEDQESGMQFLDGRIHSLETENAALRMGMSELKSFMKKGLRLGDKVKKRVALTLARMEVEKTVGRMKDGDASWSDFFAGFTPEEWDRVHVAKQLVRKLLADGAHEFNDSIHRIPPDEVVGSIVAMPPGSLRSAWEEVFFLAFGVSVNHHLFQEEVEYAQHEHNVLQADGK